MGADGVFTVGVGFEASTNIFQDDDEELEQDSTELGIAPVFRYERGRFGIGLDGLSYQVLENDEVSLTALLGFDGESLSVGGEAQYRLDKVYVSASAQQFVSSKFNGQEAQASIGRVWRFNGQREIDVSIGARYRNDRLSRRGLFGVEIDDDDDVRAANESIVSAVLSASFTYPITNTSGLLFSAEYEQFCSGIKETSGIDRTNAFSVGVAYVWLFY